MNIKQWGLKRLSKNNEKEREREFMSNKGGFYIKKIGRLLLINGSWILGLRIISENRDSWGDILFRYIISNYRGNPPLQE